MFLNLTLWGYGLQSSLNKGSPIISILEGNMKMDLTDVLSTEVGGAVRIQQPLVMGGMCMTGCQ